MRIAWIRKFYNVRPSRAARTTDPTPGVRDYRDGAWRVARFLIRRLGLLLLTLWLMSVLVFVIASVLPGDVAHTILGHYAAHLKR